VQIFLAFLIVTIVGFVSALAVGGGAAFWFAIAWFVGLVILSLVLGAYAKRQIDVVHSADPPTIQQVIESHFSGVGWKNVQGDGLMNFQSRGIGINSWNSKNPVVSVSLSPTVDGGTEVSIWMSEWVTRTGIVSSCDRVVSKRWTLLRKLAALEGESEVRL
jgi:hypothetical protein